MSILALALALSIQVSTLRDAPPLPQPQSSSPAFPKQVAIVWEPDRPFDPKKFAKKLKRERPQNTRNPGRR